MDPNENIKRQWHVTVQDARVVDSPLKAFRTRSGLPFDIYEPPGV